MCSPIRTSRSKLSFRNCPKERRISFRMFDHVIISCTQGKYISFVLVDGGNPRMVHPLPGWLARIMLFQSGESSLRLSTWNLTRAYRCGHVSLLSEFGPQGIYRLHGTAHIRKRSSLSSAILSKTESSTCEMILLLSLNYGLGKLIFQFSKSTLFRNCSHVTNSYVTNNISILHF